MKLQAVILLVVASFSTSLKAQTDLGSIYQPRFFQGMPFRVMKPLDFDSTKKYPVIVSLHGAGGRGADNRKQLRDWNRQLAEPKRRRDYPCYVVAPQAKDLWNAAHLNKVQALIGTLPSVDRNRIYIMGHSMGGHGTYLLIQLAPDYFAAAAPSAGAGRWQTKPFIDAEKIKDLPIWAFHGDNDQVCPYEKSQRVFKDVKAIDGNMKLTIWRGDNHNVSGKMIPGATNGNTVLSGARCDKETDFLTWLFSQSREWIEFDQQASEIQEIIVRRNAQVGDRANEQAARYLSKTVNSIRELKSVRGALLALPDHAVKSRRTGLQLRAERLNAHIEADEELVGMIEHATRASEEDAEDLEVEIQELLIELEGPQGHVDRMTATDTSVPSTEPSTTLQSGEYFVEQSWSQDRKFRRNYFVKVPNSGGQNARLGVFIFLHGNGGNAKEAMRGWLRNRKRISSRYIMVFAQGYRESWNIVSERSKADDLKFIETIVERLAKSSNVNPNDFTIMGASNGAAMVNQLAIECKLPNIRNYISGVSPLNVWQYDGKNFKAKGNDNNYRQSVVPMAGKRLLNISGTNDHLVPYNGGPSRAIPAKDGKLAFLNAEESTFVWAKAMGYQGKRLRTPTRSSDGVDFFRYLDGDIIHCKVNGAGHGATHEISEDVILKFLKGAS